MALDPTLSLVVLGLLGLFLVVTVVKSVAQVTKRAIMVGLVVVILVGGGFVQLPADIPGLVDAAEMMEPSLTGMVSGAVPVNQTNITAEDGDEANGELLDYGALLLDWLR